MNGVDGDQAYRDGLLRVKIRPDTSFLLIYGIVQHDIVERILQDRQFPHLRVIWVKGRESFSHARLHHVPFYDAGQFQNDLRLLLYSHLTLPRTFRIWPPLSSQAHERDIFLTCVHTFQHCLEMNTMIEGSTVEDQIRGFENVMEHLPRALKNRGVHALKDFAKGETVICCAAGPSMDFAWDFIRSQIPYYRVIAVDTLTKPFFDHQLSPDFFTALERDDYVVKFFEGLSFSPTTALVSSMFIQKRVLENFQGSNFFFAPTLMYSKPLDLERLGKLGAGSSVGSLNVALALLMGAKRIVLVGQDLAFGVHRASTHLQGTIDPERERPLGQEEIKKLADGGQVRSQDGSRMVWTTQNWNLFRYQIENLLQMNPGVEVINTSAHGAFIAGTRFCTLTETQRLLESEGQKKVIRVKLKETSECESQGGEDLTAVAGILKVVENEARQILTDLDASSCPDQVWSQINAFKQKWIRDSKLVYQFMISLLFAEYVRLEREMNRLQMMETPVRDLVAAHKEYFELWLRWLPRVQEVLASSRPNTVGTVAAQDGKL